MRQLFFLGLFTLLLASCNTPKDGSDANEELPAGFDYSQILVLLDNGMEPKVLEEAFTAMGLKAKSRTNRTLNEWLFSYDMEKVKPKQMMQQIKAIAGVQKADFVKLPDGN